MAFNIKSLLLAAGLGTRLSPLTEYWPKCLMPIGGRPLLEYWLYTLKQIGIDDVMVNMHYFHEVFEHFLYQDQYKDWVATDYEEVLLGTAGTLKKHSQFFKNSKILLIHADNFCQCDMNGFIKAHLDRPENAEITMMTFNTPTPESCGIVEQDENGIVNKMHEKVNDPPGNKANAAVYILEPSVLEWICAQDDACNDFSIHVLPEFYGRIYTWQNEIIHRDIGTPSSLKAVQKEIKYELPQNSKKWQSEFNKHKIQLAVRSL